MYLLVLIIIYYALYIIVSKHYLLIIIYHTISIVKQIYYPLQPSFPLFTTPLNFTLTIILNNLIQKYNYQWVHSNLKLPTISDTSFTFLISPSGGNSSDIPMMRFGENISNAFKVKFSSSLYE